MKNWPAGYYKKQQKNCIEYAKKNNKRKCTFYFYDVMGANSYT